MITNTEFQAYCQKKRESQAWIAYQALIAQRPESFRQSEELKIITDLETVCRFELTHHRTIGVMYQSPYSCMVVDLVSPRQQEPFCYERLLPAIPRGAVVSLPLYEGKFVLLQQYRHALRDLQYAFPRGFAEPGLSSQENVRKELEEELGAVVEKADFLGHVVADSGSSGTVVDVFSCRISRIETKKDYEGIQNVILLSEEELMNWIKEDRISDGFTLSAFSLWMAHRA